MISNIRRYFAVSYGLIFTLLLTASSSAQGVEIVRLNFSYDNTDHFMDIELFDVAAPLTVANYLGYVNNPDGDNPPKPKFNDTFIYRNIPGFVLQTGGYTFRPLNPLVDALISNTVPAYPDNRLSVVANELTSPVINEFNQSNLRGTIAMARLSKQPDSATKEWFINLGDNTFLDTIDGGFTVFGRVIDDGMQIADEISTFPIRPYAGTVLGAFGYTGFDNLPVVNYDVATLPAVLQEHLVMIPTITQINRPILRFTPRSVDFDLDVAGDGIEKTLVVDVRNTGNETLTMGSISSADLSAPFTIISPGTCSGAMLVQGASCSITYSFNPTVPGVFTGTHAIAYTAVPDATAYSVTVDISGEGVPQAPVLNVSDTALQFADTLINTTSDVMTLTIRNKGGDALQFTSPFTINGIDLGDFAITSGTCNTATPLLFGETCEISMSFNPVADGAKTAILSIVSNGGNIDVSLNGTATVPKISVDSALEIIAQVGGSTSKWLSVTNTGTADLVLNTALISGTDAAYFIQENDCPDTINVVDLPLGSLAPGKSCNFLIKYTPVNTGTYTAILTLTSTDPVTPSIEVILTGLSGDPAISVPATFDVGTSQVSGYSTTKEFKVSNNGNTGLIISSITGLVATDFSQTNNCVGTGIKVAPGGSCSIFITFSTATLGNQTAVMTLESNDPDIPSVNVSLSGFGDKDSDGVVSTVEASSPNTGDGNYDDIADEVQNSVASLVALNSSYITFVADNSLISNQSTTLVGIMLLSAPYIDLLGSASFDFGLYSYSITLPEGDGTDMAIILPPNVNPTTFYKYGPTADNTEPHWYEFSYDAATGTGAQYYGNITFTSPSGIKGSKNLVIVRYIDGSKGDDDMEANGVIVNTQSGLSFSKPSATDSGSVSALSLLIILIINILRREIFQQGIRRRLKYISH